MRKGLAYAILTALVFTTLEPVSKLIAHQVTSYAITFWRFIIGSVLLLPFAIIKIRKENIHITLKDIGIMTLMGGIFVCIIMVALQSAVKVADSPSIISMIFSTNSVFTIVFASFILKEKITKNKVAAVIHCSVGIILCTDFSSGTNLTSAVLGLFAAITFSIYTALSKKYMAKIGGIIQTSITFFTGSIVLLAILIIIGVDVSPEMEFKPLSILLYLGIIVTGIGYWSYFRGVEKGGPIIGSLAFFIKPILTPFATFIINGIAPDIKVFAALIFIAIGSYFAVYKKERTEENENI